MVGHEGRKPCGHFRHAGHVSREHEEAREGGEQAPVHGDQRAAVEGGERRGHDDDGSGDGHDVEHGQEGEGEQQPVGDKAPPTERHGRGGVVRIASAVIAVRVAAQPPGASDDASGRQREGQRHRAQEIAEVQPIVRVQIQVLRVAEGHDHAAEVRCQAL